MAHLTPQQIIALITQISTETIEEANTSPRIGNAFLQIFNYFSEVVPDVLIEHIDTEVLKLQPRKYIQLDYTASLNRVDLESGIYTNKHELYIITRYYDQQGNYTGVLQTRLSSAGCAWRKIELSEPQEYGSWDSAISWLDLDAHIKTSIEYAGEKDIIGAGELIRVLAGKQNVIAGKQLSTNDYSNTEKALVATISGKQEKLLPLNSPSVNQVMERLATTGEIIYGYMPMMSMGQQDLSAASFVQTYMPDSIFSFACLYNARFYNCNLSYCYFAFAKILNTDFFHSNLAGSTGFGSIEDTFGEGKAKLYNGLELVWTDGYLYNYTGVWTKGMQAGGSYTFDNVATGTDSGTTGGGTGTGTTGSDTDTYTT